MKTDTSAIQVLADLIAATIRGVGQAILLLLPWIIRLAIVALAVRAVTGTFLAILVAFGHNFMAILPALALTLFPIALALSTDLPGPDERWGRLLASAIIVYATGWTIQHLGAMTTFVPPTLLAFCIVALLKGGNHRDRQPRYDNG